MRLSPGTPLQPLSSRTFSARISRRWLTLARGAWVVCALLLLANFVASIPTYYQLMRTVCTLPNQAQCTNTFGQLTPDNVAALTHLHLSLTGYAAYIVTLNVLFSLLPWGLGLLIFWRKSDERMGLFVSLLCVLSAGTGSVNTLLGVWTGTQPPPLLSTLFNLISGVEWIGLGAFLLTFPTGRFVPRWSWLVLSFWIITFLWNLLPWNSLPPLLTQLLQVVALLTSLLVFGGTLFIMVYRYVRVYDATQRQQAKWFVYAAIVSLSLLVLGTWPPSIVPADSPSQLLFPTITLFSSAVFSLGLGLAILRYRLWDIDAIINRTLVYGLLTTILLVVYLALVFTGQTLLSSLLGRDNSVVLVGSTLIVAALFEPIRHRIQHLIDRRFYRRKYDAQKTLASFSITLRNEVDLPSLSEHLVAVVEETMQPVHVSLWLPQREQRRKQTPVRS